MVVALAKIFYGNSVDSQWEARSCQNRGLLVALEEELPLYSNIVFVVAVFAVFVVNVINVDFG